MGKTDNGILVVTTHLYNGKKSLPLDIELYQHASSLPQGKIDYLITNVDSSLATADLIVTTYAQAIALSLAQVWQTGRWGKVAR